MATEAPGRPTLRRIDGAALARHARRMAAAPGAPWLHEEVARRMGERLALTRLQPGRIADWWAHAGGGAAVLRRTYPDAAWQAVEPVVATARIRPGRWWDPRRWARAAPPPMVADALEDGSVELVWANMMLHAEADPLATMRRWHRALAVDGFLMFSTLGPGSLLPLRALYGAAGWGPPMAPLTDMHDLGDMLVEAGFAGPVMDQETVTLTWRDGAAALAELRQLGGNADPARAPGLRTPRWRERLLSGLERHARGRDGRIELGFEVVYGHAFKPPPRARVAPESSVALADLRAAARTAGRRRDRAQGMPGV
jgi:malonyl-CoA O-methyltransferase